ncbi:unknown [Eggerthella sp. CAG:298]|nr:unknown [Eggerthella sp. CAG:298]
MTHFWLFWFLVVQIDTFEPTFGGLAAASMMKDLFAADLMV